MLMSRQRSDVTQLLAVVAAGFAVVLGGLMLIGGLGVAYALATSIQPPLQYLDAAILIGVGAVNVWASLHFRTKQRPAVLASAVATTTLVVYLAVIDDLGEPFLVHLLYLALLAALAYSGRSIRATA